MPGRKEIQHQEKEEKKVNNINLLLGLLSIYAHQLEHFGVVNLELPESINLKVPYMSNVRSLKLHKVNNICAKTLIMSTTRKQITDLVFEGRDTEIGQ